MRRCSRALLAVAILLAASLTVAGCEKAPKEEGGVRATLLNEGDTAPAFRMKTLKGGDFRLSGEGSAPVVINFFASWCGPCRDEAKGLQKTYDAFKERGVEFAGVAVQDSPEGVSRYVKEFGITFPVGIDSSGEIASAYKIYGLPRTFVIGGDGRIVFMRSGPLTEEDLATELKRLL